MKLICSVLLLFLFDATAHGGVHARGLILDLDADKGVAVEDGNRVVKWTNQVASFVAKDFEIITSQNLQ